MSRAAHPVPSTARKPARALSHTSAAPAWSGKAIVTRAILFFLLFFAYVWQRIEPVAVQFHSGPLFFFGSDFLHPYMQYPGGLLDYAAAFLAQLNHFNWLGAALLTLMTALICLFGHAVAQRIHHAVAYAISLVPAFLILLLLDFNDIQVLPVCLGLLVSLATALAYLVLLRPAPLWRIAAAWVLSAGVFYLAGTWPCLLTVTLIVISEFRSARNWQVPVLCSFVAAVVPLWAALSHYPYIRRVLLPWGTEARSLICVCALYLIFPLVTLLSRLFRKTRQQDTAPSEARHGKSQPSLPQRGWATPRAKQAIGTAGILIGCVAVWFAFDATAHAPGRIDYYSSKGFAAKVIATAADPSVKRLDGASEIRLHRALYQTRGLCEDLFTIKKQRLWSLLPSLEIGLPSCRAHSETLLDLGLVSDAEHFAHEALEFEGERSDILRRLACINVLKDRPLAARMFVTRAAQMPFQGAWTTPFLADLDSDPQLARNPALSAVRSSMLTNDLPHEGLPVEPLLRRLLSANPNNKMAAEYLMACYLLEPNLDRAIDLLVQLDCFGGTQIPRHCEETVLLYQQRKNVRVNLNGRTIRAETRERFDQFLDGMKQQLYNTADGRAALERQFGDTFWYYFYTSPAQATQAQSKGAGS